jgi:hypothetical protein
MGQLDVSAGEDPSDGRVVAGTAAEPVRFVLQSPEGSAGVPDTQACLRLAALAFERVIGGESGLASLNLNVGADWPPGPISIDVSVTLEKRTRSVLFVSAEGVHDGVSLFSAQAVFRRPGELATR